MQAQAPPYLFKETRINLDSPLSNSTVILRLPVPGASTRLARTQKRPLATEIALTEDENAFKSKHLASASSIYLTSKFPLARLGRWESIVHNRCGCMQTRERPREPSHTTTLLFEPNSTWLHCICRSRRARYVERPGSDRIESPVYTHAETRLLQTTRKHGK
jgi:hypothetical protein